MSQQGSVPRSPSPPKSPAAPAAEATESLGVYVAVTSVPFAVMDEEVVQLLNTADEATAVVRWWHTTSARTDFVAELRSEEEAAKAFKAAETVEFQGVKLVVRRLAAPPAAVPEWLLAPKTAAATTAATPSVPYELAADFEKRLAEYKAPEDVEAEIAKLSSRRHDNFGWVSRQPPFGR